uniref:Uncharacterized protein n=1 Tax=Populus trichocarpa TaxID=3694 RepID=A0A2K1ZDN4_POPTR
MRSSNSSLSTSPSWLASAWWSPRAALKAGISAPRRLKACFSSFLLRRPSLLISDCMKIALNCSSVS